MLEIKGFDSSDYDLHWWTPDHLEDVYFDLNVTIGLEGDVAADNFKALVATPEGMRKHGTETVLSDRGLILLSDYSPKLLRQTLDDIVKRCRSTDWNESVLKLQRYFHWEYEDYRG